jgi:ribosomal protein S18 acetylase RimI-like enzyme
MTARIEVLEEITEEDVERLIVGYGSAQRYDVHWVESFNQTSFTLDLIDLDQPFVKRWSHGHLTGWYQSLLADGLSFGAWESNRLVGIAITERRQWNDEAMVWELHVEDESRGKGTGRRLLEAVEKAARLVKVRAVVLETQTPNVSAISFYRACGYSMQGVDLSFYTNTDLERGEVAVFMKKSLEFE